MPAGGDRRPGGRRQGAARGRDGYRESTDSWATVMRDLKARGANEPLLVVGDGALGTWAALRDVFPARAARRAGCTRSRGCWTRPETAATQGEELAARDHGGPDPQRAAIALERFRNEFAAKYPKAIAKLDRDREAPHPSHEGRRLQEGGAYKLPMPPRSAGRGSTATSSSATCSPARSSRTGSRSPRTTTTTTE